MKMKDVTFERIKRHVATEKCPLLTLGTLLNHLPSLPIMNSCDPIYYVVAVQQSILNESSPENHTLDEHTDHGRQDNVQTHNDKKLRHC